MAKDKGNLDLRSNDLLALEARALAYEQMAYDFRMKARRKRNAMIEAVNNRSIELMRNQNDKTK